MNSLEQCTEVQSLNMNSHKFPNNKLESNKISTNSCYELNLKDEEDIDGKVFINFLFKMCPVLMNATNVVHIMYISKRIVMFRRRDCRNTEVARQLKTIHNIDQS